jgi:spermidine dehydrogenase
MPGLSSGEKKAHLWRISYRDYLLDLVKVDPSVIPLYQSRTHGEWGVGIDAVSALDVWPFGLPGFQGLKLGGAPQADREQHAAKDHQIHPQGQP